MEAKEKLFVAQQQLEHLQEMSDDKQRELVQLRADVAAVDTKLSQREEVSETMCVTSGQNFIRAPSWQENRMSEAQSVTKLEELRTNLAEVTMETQQAEKQLAQTKQE